MESSRSMNFLVPRGTKVIKSNEFNLRKDLFEVYIPKSVKKIGSGAFYNCVNLRRVIFEEGSALRYLDNSIFQNCMNLEYINIPDTVIYIHSHCFWDCVRLPTELTLPKSLSYVESTAFYNTKLKRVYLPDNCKYQNLDKGFPYALSFPERCEVIGGVGMDFYNKINKPLSNFEIDFKDTVISDDDSTNIYIVPQGTTEIYHNQFSERRDLKRIIIPKSVKKIGANAFYFCLNLREVIFEEGSELKYIDYFVFQNCMNLEHINIPLGVKQIKAHSFWGCASLKELIFPETLEEIDATAFYTTSLQYVKIPVKCKYQEKRHAFPNEASFPNGCQIKGGIAFDFYENRISPIPPIVNINTVEHKDVVFDDSKFVVPQGTKEISSNQFNGRTDLVDIIIPKSIERISPCAFYLCRNLKTVTFEEGSNLKVIEGVAFQNCHELEEINFPEGLEQIEAHCFWACHRLSSVSFPKSLKIIDATAFYTTSIYSVTLSECCKYQAVRNGFPYETTFPENCDVIGGISCDLYSEG